MTSDVPEKPLHALTSAEHSLIVTLLRGEMNATPLLRGLWNRQVRASSRPGAIYLEFVPLADGAADEPLHLIGTLAGEFRIDAVFIDSDGIHGNIVLTIDDQRRDLQKLSVWKVDFSEVRQIPAPDSIRFPRKATSIGPYTDDYPTCEKCDAALLIYADEIPPDDISALLGLRPTRASIEGQPRNPARPTVGVHKRNLWFYETLRLVPSFDLRRHIDHLLVRLECRAAALNELRAQPGVSVRFLCSWWSRWGDGGPIVTPRQMGVLADLDLELEIGYAHFGTD